jgi:hypothetical protein
MDQTAISEAFGAPIEPGHFVSGGDGRQRNRVRMPKGFVPVRS